MNGWATFFWALGATIVLVTVGIVGILLSQGRITWLPDELPVVAPTPTIEPTLDTSYSVLVLNGTLQDGLASTKRDELIAAGWTQDAVLASNASRRDITETIVYYTGSEAEPAALGLADLVGADGVQLDPEYPLAGTPPTQLTLVLGTGTGEGETPAPEDPPVG